MNWAISNGVHGHILPPSWIDGSPFVWTAFAQVVHKPHHIINPKSSLEELGC